VRAPHPTTAREPREENWRRVVFRGPDGEQIELRG
jgi:lactoylglutathione lyase